MVRCATAACGKPSGHQPRWVLHRLDLASCSRPRAESATAPAFAGATARSNRGSYLAECFRARSVALSQPTQRLQLLYTGPPRRGRRELEHGARAAPNVSASVGRRFDSDSSIPRGARTCPCRRAVALQGAVRSSQNSDGPGGTARAGTGWLADGSKPHARLARSCILRLVPKVTAPVGAAGGVIFAMLVALVAWRSGYQSAREAEPNRVRHHCEQARYGARVMCENWRFTGDVRQCFAVADEAMRHCMEALPP